MAKIMGEESNGEVYKNDCSSGNLLPAKSAAALQQHRKSLSPISAQGTHGSTAARRRGVYDDATKGEVTQQGRADVHH